jgi:hypothetical protein
VNPFFDVYSTIGILYFQQEMSDGDPRTIANISARFRSYLKYIYIRLSQCTNVKGMQDLASLWNRIKLYCNPCWNKIPLEVNVFEYKALYEPTFQMSYIHIITYAIWSND